MIGSKWKNIISDIANCGQDYDFSHANLFNTSKYFATQRLLN